MLDNKLHSFIICSEGCLAHLFVLVPFVSKDRGWKIRNVRRYVKGDEEILLVDDRERNEKKSNRRNVIKERFFIN